MGGLQDETECLGDGCSDESDQEHAMPFTQEDMLSEVYVDLSDKYMEENGQQQPTMDVAAVVMNPDDYPAPQAKRERMCQLLAERLRDRPTVPPSDIDADKPWGDVCDGVRWPMKHCAFKGCRWHSESRDWKSEMCNHLEASAPHGHNEDFQYAQYHSAMDESAQTLRLDTGSSREQASHHEGAILLNLILYF